jgi:hypothetical protein
MMRIVIAFGRPATRLTDARFNIITNSRKGCRRYLRTPQSLVPVYRTVNLYIGECRLYWLGLRTRLLPDLMMSHIMLTLLTLDTMAWSYRKNARHQNPKKRCTENCMQQDEEEDQK